MHKKIGLVLGACLVVLSGCGQTTPSIPATIQTADDAKIWIAAFADAAERSDLDAMKSLRSELGGNIVSELDLYSHEQFQAISDALRNCEDPIKSEITGSFYIKCGEGNDTVAVLVRYGAKQGISF